MREIYCETEHLIIRPLNAEDYDIFREGFDRCLPKKNRFDDVPEDISYMTKEWYSAMLIRRENEAERDYSYVLHIFLKKDGSSAGYCDITPHVRDNFQYGRIGYTLHNYLWGKGYGTELVIALKKLAFEAVGLHRIEAHVDIDNSMSARVLEKAGFEYEGIRRSFIYEDGEWQDQKIFAVIDN